MTQRVSREFQRLIATCNYGVVATLPQRPKQSRWPRDLQLRPRSDPRPAPDEGQHEQHQRKQQETAADSTERGEWTSLRRQPEIKGNETYNNHAECGESRHTRENSDQNSVAGPAANLDFRPVYLLIDVGTNSIQETSPDAIKVLGNSTCTSRRLSAGSIGGTLPVKSMVIVWNDCVSRFFVSD